MSTFCFIRHLRLCSRHVRVFVRWKTEISSQLAQDAKKSLISHETGLSMMEVQHLFEKCVSFHVLGSQKILEFFNTLKHNGFEVKEAVDNFSIFSLSERVIQFRSQSLKEIGFLSIMMTDITCYRSLMNMKLLYLRQKGVIRSAPELKLFLGEQEYPRKFIDCVLKTYSQETATLEDLRVTFLSSWIQCFLNSSEEEANQLIRKHGLKSKTLKDLMSSWKFLTEVLTMQSTQIKQHASLLLMEPVQMEQFFKVLPRIGGISSKEAIIRCPRLLNQPPENIIKCVSILKRYGVSDDTIGKRLLKLLLHPNKLKRRFLVRYKSADPQKLQSKSTVSCYVSRFHRITKLLQSHGQTLSTLDVALLTKTCSMSWKLTMYMLAGRLKVSADLLAIYIKQHMKFKQLDAKNALAILQLLEVNNFTTKQIVNAIELTLYSHDEILHELVKLKDDPELQPHNFWVTSDNYLQFLLYRLEVRVNFANIKRW